MEDRKTVLIIDDSVVYQKTLSRILEKSYNVLTADNGKEATEILLDRGPGISLIFLDLMMPIMDGYGFLKWVMDNGQYIDIPIVVTTSNSDLRAEVQCLELGASEFVTKPFNPEIVIKRSESLIRLHETSALLNNMKYDPVTGALNKTMFIEQMMRVLKRNPDTEYDLVCFDIEGYRMLIDRYGEKRCSMMQRNVYNLIASTLTDDYYLGKLSESQFAFIGPTKPMEEHEKEMMDGLKLTKKMAINGVIVNCGVYQNVDRNLDAETIVHNAIMAADSIRNRYGVYCAKYDESLRERASKERFIADNMKTALDEHQFVVYYQPKFLISNNTVSGAEALVRWIHPEKGFMNPGDFIPIFEHNGFIQELDKYMLEATCRHLREWLNAGKIVVPISVNVSQANFDKVALADEFEEIVDRYGIDHSYIHFEITESINSTDAKKKNFTVNRFREKGFSVELDDFGSGYSSLTTLSELPVDVVKLDMSLIQKMFEKKHSAVLSGALFTARELTLKVVAEGVETEEQLQELKWRGSHIKEFSVQGFYFSKPLPKEEFEKYLATSEGAELNYVAPKEKTRIPLSATEYAENESVNASYNAEYQLKKYKALMEIPGTVMYEYNHFTDEMSVEIFEEGGSRKRSTGNYFTEVREKHWIHASYVDSYIDTIRMVYTYGRAKDVLASALMSNGDYRLCRYYFAPIKDEQGSVKRVVGRGEVVDYAKDTDVFRNITTGSFRYNAEYKQEFDYISESLLDFLGFESETEFRQFYNNSFIDFVYEEDRERVLAEIDDQMRGDNVDYCEYRIVKPDGSLIWVYDRGTLVSDEFGRKWFYVTIADLDDYKTKQLRRQRELDRMVNKFKSDSNTQDKLTRLDTYEYSLHLIQKYVEKKDTGIFFLFDIDNLTSINERHGHVTGDQMIIEFADVLKSTFREGDIVGRYIGDRFIAYMPEVGNKDLARKKASTVMNRALKIKSDGVIPLSISVAMVADTSIAESSEELMNMAKGVLENIKANGKSDFGFYENPEE